MKTVIILLVALAAVALGLWLLPEEAKTVLNIAGFAITALVIFAAVYVLFWVGKSRTKSSNKKEREKPEKEVEGRSRIIVTKSESSRSDGTDWWVIGGGVLVAVFLVWLFFFGGLSWFASLGDDRPTTRSGNSDKSASAVHVQVEAVVLTAPRCGEAIMPAAESNQKSEVVRVPPGHRMCGDATLGTGSYQTECSDHQDTGWFPLSPGNCEDKRFRRFQSDTTEQELAFCFIPAQESCD